MASFNPEKVLAMAPDASAAKAAQGLGAPSKWLQLSQNPDAIWGECQGSGAAPYRTQVYLSGPAFKCTCPSRKFPCKHGLGLLLAFAQNPNRFSQSPPPLWVSEWLERRDALADKKTAETQPVERTAAQEEDSKKDALRRAARREQKVKEGLLALDLWLGDAARQGLARIQQQPADYWDNMAARLVDAQATGLARRIKLCASLPHSGGNWAARLLDRLSRIHLLIEAARRINCRKPCKRTSAPPLAGRFVKRKFSSFQW